MAPEPNQDHDSSRSVAPRKTLRIALAMRGGVSMAVWIGGAVAELDLLRRAALAQASGTPLSHLPPRAADYLDLLNDNGYNKVEFDILAGASAGGLNAILFAVAQTYGVATDDIVQRMWADQAGIWRLLRDSGCGAVPSLLKGDERLLALASETLRDISEGPGVAEAAARYDITVELAATLLPDALEPDLNNQAGFTFTRRRGGLASCYTTIPGLGDDTAEALAARERLALAGRSTSSFPGAFEPASVFSVADNVTLADALNMATTFPFARPARPVDQRSEPFFVLDGGVFDNIPIDRALRAVGRAPAGNPSERRLLYLDPQPPAKRDPVKAAKDIPKASTRKKDESEQKVQSGRWAHIVRTANSLRERVESADLEIGQIREHNDNVMAIRGRLEGLAAAMANSDVAIEVNIGQYVQSRIGFDAKRIGELLTSPWAYMSMPPHSASRYRALKPLRAMRVAHALKHAYDHSASTDAKATQWPVEWIGPDMVPKAFAIGDIGAAVDAARVLIAWTQKMQQIQGGHQHDLSRLKRGLYRCLTVLVEARRTMVDDSVLVLANSDIAEGIRLGLCKQTRLCMTWSLFQLLKIRVDKSDDALDAELFIELARSPGTAEAGRNHLYFPPVQSEIGPTLFLTLIWLALEGYRSALGVISQNVQPFASDARKWDESAFRQAGLPKYASLDCYALVRVFSLAGTPNTADIIQFQRITGDERPHLQDGDLSDLRNAAIASTLERWLRTNVDPNSIQRQHLQKSMQATVELKSAEWKLDGIPLARFGGFLARRWRINDWYWGRLDAAAGIVRMLPPATSESDDSEHRSVQSKLQDSIFRESKEFTTSADGKGLAAIPGWYRSAIAARLGPLALRALWPQDLPTGSLSTWAKVIGLLLARPLTVLVALVVDPLRFAAAFAISLGTTAMLSRAERPRHGQAFPPDAHYLSTFALGLMLVGAVIGSGVLISRGIGVRGRWRRLKEIVAIGLSNHPHQREPHNLWNITLDAARKPAIATCWLSIVIGCGLTPLTAVVVSVPAVRKFVSPELAIAVAACVVGLILDLNNRAQTVRRVRQPVRPAQPIQPPEKRLLMWLLLAVGGGIVTLDSILGAEHRWHWSTSLTENPSPWIAGIEAIVLTYLTVCHWADKRSIVLLMVGTTAAAVLPQVVATCIHKGVLPGVLPTVVLIIILGFSLQYVRPVTWENDQAPPKRFAVLD